MSDIQLYQNYLSWLGNSPSAVRQGQLFDLPVGSFDVLEDDAQVVNRLVYLIPDFSAVAPRCFCFFEENTFTKDDRGDLTLVHSDLLLFDP